MTKRKPPAKDWRNRAIDDWTVATFQAYLCDEHERLYGIKYTARNYGMEGRWIKLMLAEHGAEVVRKFIDACFAEYRPTPQYPGINFSFMFCYQKNRILPRVLAGQKRNEQTKQSQNLDFNELESWL